MTFSNIVWLFFFVVDGLLLNRAVKCMHTQKKKTSCSEVNLVTANINLSPLHTSSIFYGIHSFYGIHFILNINSNVLSYALNAEVKNIKRYIFLI